MAKATSQDGTIIAFDRYGNGPALIVVSGAMSIRAYRVSFAETLAPHFTVYIYDRRGRGDSGDTPPYAVEREIEDLEAMIEEAGGSAFVLGYSSGAVLLLRAAASGLAIEKLAVYEPPFVVDDSRPPVPDDYVAHLNELVNAGKRGEAVTYFMTAAAGIPAEQAAQMQEGPMLEASKAVAHTIAYDGMVMGDTMSGRPLAKEPWSKITVPTLVLDGGASFPWLHRGTKALADVLPDAQRRTLEGQDHIGAD